MCFVCFFTKIFMLHLQLCHNKINECMKMEYWLLLNYKRSLEVFCKLLISHVLACLLVFRHCVRVIIKWQ